MEGRVQDCSGRSGTIIDSDGHCYRFGAADWNVRRDPTRGQTVQFLASGDRAVAIYPAVHLPFLPMVRRKKRATAILLAIFLGCLGAHKFYLGRHVGGIVYLILALTLVGALITTILSIIDMVGMLLMSDDDFERVFG